MSGTVGNGLGTTANYLRRTTGGSAGNVLGATINYLRRTTSGAAGSGLGKTIKTCDAHRAVQPTAWHHD
jgi:hypothetical protein